MKNTKIIFEDNLKLFSFKNNSVKQLSKKFDKIYFEVKSDIYKKNRTLNILNKNFRYSFQIKDLRKFRNFKSIALIGMGGSILGAEAIYNYFQNIIKKKVYFFDNIDEKKLSIFKKKQNLTKVLFVIISKSGNTIETIANTFALDILKKNAKNIIIITEKNNNLLFLLSKKFNLFFVEHKNYVGGRYSVLSDVGLIPAYLMGVNISKLRLKIDECIKEKNKNFLKKRTIQLANFIKSKNYNNLVFLNYSPELEKFLYWCQQLVAESLGKKNKGLLPSISNAPKDHHSLLQLYLDGPKDKFFNIFSCEKQFKEKIKISKDTGIKSFLNEKRLSTIKLAQKKALVKSFQKKNISFREIKIKAINEETLGKLFSSFIVETIIVGKLLDINPYDQPAVEQVKIYTKKLLT